MTTRPQVERHTLPSGLTILVETLDPEGPYGAKEAGEGPLHPSVPAIANAIHDAIGVRMKQLPFTPGKVLKALREKRAEGRAWKGVV